jgi:hypothetical protein
MAVMLIVSAGALGVPLAAGGKQPKCQIVNTRVDASYATLQAANDASSTRAGDTLAVRGTCIGTATLSKNVTVVGRSNPGWGQATLDGNQLGSVVTVNSGLQVAISNLTITHGTGSIPLNQTVRLGGGIRNYGLLTLMGVSITGNAAQRGGGVWTQGDLTVNHSSVSGNTAQGGGGIYVPMALSTPHTAVSITDSEVEGNTASGSGGGITLDEGGSLTVTRSSVSRNVGLNGGGFEGSKANLTCNDSSFEGNTASGSGGAIQDDGGLHTFNDCRIVGNRAASGGGIDGYISTYLVFNGSSIVANNIASDFGGGIIKRDGTITFNDTASVSGNTASTGAGISLAGGGQLTLNDSSSIHNNTATVSGGGVAAGGGSVTLNGSSSIHDNTAGVSGGGIYASFSTLFNCVAGTNVYGNTPDDISP